jgi:hypothetical protein
MQTLTEDLKKELVMFVLDKCPVWHFNACTKAFSIQKLYGRYRKDLMAAYPELMPGNLYYAIAMSEAFSQYKCCEVECPRILHQIDTLKWQLFHYPKYHPERVKKAQEYNDLVKVYNEMLKPQNKLIALYKKVQHQKSQALTSK